MPLASETQLGPYKIVSLIGSGGMGEVYRARDTRLLRDVALKVLPPTFTVDADRLRRFEQEARAVAALNHPNIVSVYDVGESGGVHYIVSELLEGETLRQRITASGMPARKAIELATQLAQGLAAAHDQNIVHRDLKPENLFITRNGRLKILDFGLAKLRRAPGSADATEGITVAGTEAGQVMGTAGYMSPEQVKGEAADHRSDIFSFGSILYEMLNGQRAFRRNTSAETMTAILNEEPAEFTAQTGAIAPALERIVRHCMEKQPAQRFQSAHDIAFALDSLSGISQTSTAAATATPAAKRRAWLLPALAGLAILAVGLAAGLWLQPQAKDAHPQLHRITFRRGTIWSARFTPDGNLAYAAAWEGKPVELYASQATSTESRPLGMSGGLVAISASGELAVLTDFQSLGFESFGMLGRAPLGGGAPRQIASGVEYADWTPDGESLAIARRVTGKGRLEFPVGKVLYETTGWVGNPRLSRDGKMIAFIDHPYERDDQGAVAQVDLAGNKKTLTQNFVSANGLAWSPDGREIWFTATPSGSSRELRAVTPDGKERLVYLGTGTLTLHDIYKDGRVLFTRDDLRAGMIGLAPGESKERDLSWHDWTIPRDLSNDGKMVAFDETGEAGGATGAIYVRGTDGTPAVRLHEGANPTLSPDAKWVLGRGFATTTQHTILKLPTGAGESATISTADVLPQRAFYFPDNRHILVVGSQTGHGSRLWVMDDHGESLHPVSPEGASIRRRGCISPDGTRIAARDPEGRMVVYPADGQGNPTVVSAAQPDEEPYQWTADGKTLLVGHSEIPARVFTVNLTTNERKLLRAYTPADATGLFGSNAPTFSADLKSYVYSYQRMTSDLYIVDGLK
jgi:Tol biopolymer transport system component